LCVRGDQQTPDTYNDIYAPVIRGEIIRLLTSLLVNDTELIAEQMDAVSAFLNGNLSEDIFMYNPPGRTSSSRFVRLVKTLYGLKQAPFEWHHVIDEFLHSIGFVKLKSANCL